MSAIMSGEVSVDMPGRRCVVVPAGPDLLVAELAAAACQELELDVGADVLRFSFDGGVLDDAAKELREYGVVGAGELLVAELTTEAVGAAALDAFGGDLTAQEVRDLSRLYRPDPRRPFQRTMDKIAAAETAVFCAAAALSSPPVRYELLRRMFTCGETGETGPVDTPIAVPGMLLPPPPPPVPRVPEAERKAKIEALLAFGLEDEAQLYKEFKRHVPDSSAPVAPILHHAVEYGAFEYFAALVDAGADVRLTARNCCHGLCVAFTGAYDPPGPEENIVQYLTHLRGRRGAAVDEDAAIAALRHLYSAREKELAEGVRWWDRHPSPQVSSPKMLDFLLTVPHPALKGTVHWQRAVSSNTGTPSLLGFLRGYVLTPERCWVGRGCARPSEEEVKQLIDVMVARCRGAQPAGFVNAAPAHYPGARAASTLSRAVEAGMYSVARHLIEVHGVDPLAEAAPSLLGTVMETASWGEGVRDAMVYFHGVEEAAGRDPFDAFTCLRRDPTFLGGHDARRPLLCAVGSPEMLLTALELGADPVVAFRSYVGHVLFAPYSTNWLPPFRADKGAFASICARLPESHFDAALGDVARTLLAADDTTALSPRDFPDRRHVACEMVLAFAAVGGGRQDAALRLAVRMRFAADPMARAQVPERRYYPETNETDGEPWNPLVRDLLGADGFELPRPTPGAADPAGLSAIDYAGDVATAEALARRGWAVKVAGRTGLHEAASRRKAAALMEFYLLQGAAVDADCGGGRATAFALMTRLPPRPAAAAAAEGGGSDQGFDHAGVVEALIVLLKASCSAAGAVNDAAATPFLSEAVLHCCEAAHLDGLRLALDRGGRADATYHKYPEYMAGERRQAHDARHKQTALHVCLRVKWAAGVALLLDRGGCGLDARDGNGHTAVEHALSAYRPQHRGPQAWYLKMAETLFAAGAALQEHTRVDIETGGWPSQTPQRYTPDVPRDVRAKVLGLHAAACAMRQGAPGDARFAAPAVHADPVATYPYDALRVKTSTLTRGQIDVTKREQYLTQEEFEDVFGMERAAFEKLAKWKRDELKKRKGLF